MEFRLQDYIEPDFTKEIFRNANNAVLEASPKDMVAPDNFHATSIFPEYFKVEGEWLLAEDTRMDSVAIYEEGKIYIRELRNVKKGDLIFIGRTENCEEGIYVHVNCFTEEESDEDKAFSFRQGRSRETGFSYDYNLLYDLLKYERENNGYVVWVLGPACTFDNHARESFSKLIENGYVNALLAGNALATHDLEAGYFGTALGQNIRNQKHQFNGHYNHIDAINKVNFYGSIKGFIENEHINNGIIYSCVKNQVPFVLNGSIRDDGPLPEVYEHTYIGQDAMRSHIRKATTVIGMATTLHTIATGNMTPVYRVMKDGTKRQIFFYTIDTAEFAVNKLSDRGSLGARGIVTNVQDFVVKICENLGL